MMPRPFMLFLGGLFVARVAVSFILSDGLFKSDSLTYVGAVVNLCENGSLSSIQPEDEKRFAHGADAYELYQHLKGISDPLYRPLGFQWLHSVLYAPILFFWKSLTPVILINNLLFFGAGMFFFRAPGMTAGVAAQAAAWIVYAFFPPFFYLTSQFFSEPLFLFFFGALILLAEREGNEQFFLLFIAATALCLTRPFGVVIVLALAAFSAVKTRYGRAFGLVTAAGLAAGVNAVVMMNAFPANARIYSVSAAETFYCTTASAGNGDYDYYFVVPDAAQSDTTLRSYHAGTISGIRLMAETAAQNLRAPARFVKNSFYKLSNYFFGVVPNQWIYPEMRRQSIVKKLLWMGQNLIFYALVIAGLIVARNRGTDLFGFLFTVGLVFHFFLLARYRYALPMLAYGAAFLPPVFESWMPRQRNHQSPP
jgi:hypothetical protein